MPRGPRGPIEKPKDRKKVLLRLWTYIYAHKWMALGAVLLTVASNLLALLGPMLSGAAIDAIGIEPGQADFPTVFFYCGLMIVFYAVSSLLSYILSILMIQLSQKIVFQMRQQVFDRLTQLPVRYFDGHQTGDIVSRISYDIDTVNASLSNDLLQIAASVITVVGSFIMMVAISPVLVLVFVITIPMSILFTRYMTKKVRPLFHQRSVKLGEMNGFVEEVITGQKTTKAYHQEETMVSRFDERNKAAVDAYYNADYYGGMTGPSVNFINNLSLAFVSIFGAILFLWGNLSIGNLSSFVLYSRRFSGPINEVANIISELQSACAAAERVFRLIDEEPEPADAPGAVAIQQVEGQVAMDHVKFGYNPGKTIIHDLSFTAPPGSLTAIVGPTGAGKSTVMGMISRLIAHDSGLVDFEGKDIGKWKSKELSKRLAILTQSNNIQMKLTVRELVTFGRFPYSGNRVTPEDQKIIDRAIHYMELEEFQDRFIDELSGGQRQRALIAMVIAQDTEYVLLDEPTNNLDIYHATNMMKIVRRLCDELGKTVILVLHEINYAAFYSDYICAFKDGKIAKFGTVEEVMTKENLSQIYQVDFEILTIAGKPLSIYY